MIMITKRYFRLSLSTLLFSLSMLLLASCSDFLDKDIQGNATDETYYDTPYKLQSALDAVYDVLQRDDYNNQEWRFGEAMGDNVLGVDEGLGSEMGHVPLQYVERLDSSTLGGQLYRCTSRQPSHRKHQPRTDVDPLL